VIRPYTGELVSRRFYVVFKRAKRSFVRADPNLTHPADRILTRGLVPTV
jgi:hypothetical protein